MTSHSLLPRLFPLFFFLCLALLSWMLHFNGLYGQDAHEYLRQSLGILNRFQGLPAPVQTIGDAEFAGGYPLVAALLAWLTGHLILALQLVSCLAAAGALWVFERLLALLAPGARMDSRWAYAGVGLALAPLFLRAGLCSMSDALGLLSCLLAFFFGLCSLESGRWRDAVLLAVFAAWAVTIRYALAGMMLPLTLGIAYHWLEQKKGLWIAVALGAGCLAMLPHFWLKADLMKSPLEHSLFQNWSMAHFFQRSFSNESGAVHYPLPNIAYLLYPLAYPGFFLALGALFFLFKKTDLTLPAKKLLLGCLLTYLFLLGGLPHQNARYLLPAYAVLLLLLFPAWDRFYCYGFIFFWRLTLSIIFGALLAQLLFCIWFVRPVISRNRMEQTVAQQLQAVLPPNALLYAFDLDVSMHSYLPGLEIRNLWAQRYAEFPAGSYVMFKEALRPQWQGQNPILNWDDLRSQRTLELRAELPEGWGLWEIK